MLASIVVVPRERFTSLPVSLRSLFSTIAEDVPVVVVEGGTPAERQDDSIWLGVRRDDTKQTALAQELVALPRPSLVSPEDAGAGIALERT